MFFQLGDLGHSQQHLHANTSRATSQHRTRLYRQQDTTKPKPSNDKLRPLAPFYHLDTDTDRSNGAHMDSRQVASFKTSCCVLIWVSNDMGIECLSTRSLPYRLAAFTRHTKSCARKRPMHCKQDTKLTKPPHKTYQVSGEETTQTLNRNMGGASCLLLPVGCRWDDQELQSATLVLLHQLPLELLHLLHLSHNMSCYTILFHLFPLAPDQQDCVYLTAMAAVECGGFMWWILVYLPRSSWV